MDLHFEGNKLYYMEKEAELIRVLGYVSKEIGEQETMTTEQMWELFNILMDTTNIYRHITDYFNTLDRAILDARIKNGKLKQELYDMKKENERLQKMISDHIDGF
jgi:hypothetical protein